MDMKKNKYLKAKLTADTEEDCLYNTFWIYVAGISELLLIVMLQGELNYISIPCLISVSYTHLDVYKRQGSVTESSMMRQGMNISWTIITRTSMN